MFCYRKGAALHQSKRVFVVFVKEKNIRVNPCNPWFLDVTKKCAPLRSDTQTMAKIKKSLFNFQVPRFFRAHVSDGAAIRGE